MANSSSYDAWSMGQNYEHYMGRWSRMVAAEFLTWLDAPQGADWLEVGCGTGALTAAILETQNPKSILATDASEDFVEHASVAISDPRTTFQTAKAQELPVSDASYDVVASALVMNFVPDKVAALAEMRRVVRPGGLLSFYVWNYPDGGMGFIDAFWKTAAEIDPKAVDLDEAKRFPDCTVAGLKAWCDEAELPAAEIAMVETETRFPDFEAFWRPFTMGAGPAPGYCASLTDNDRDALKSRLRQRLGNERAISMPARAWAVRSRV